MNPQQNSLQRYQDFVDGLVKRREGVLPDWIRGNGWPHFPENEQVNTLLSKLTPEEKDAVARIAREARDSGIHDTLVFLQEQMDLKGLRLVMDGAELPVSPHGTEIYWDWGERADGVPWPAPPADK